MHSRSSFYKYLWSALGVIIFVGSLYLLVGNGVQAPDTQETYHPYRKDLEKKVVASGSIQPIKEIAIKSRISGVVEELFVIPGQHVHNGEVIARLKVIPDLVQANTLENELRKATLNVEYAKRQYESALALSRKQILAGQELANAALDLKLRQAEFDSAQRTLGLVRDGRTKTSSTDEITAQNVVIATTDGVVLDVPVKAGQFITALNNITEGTTIALIADISQLIFKGKIPESDVGQLSPGMPVNLFVSALGGGDVSGELDYVSPRGIEEDGSVKFEVRARLAEGSNEVLRAGYTANADIVTSTSKNALAIHSGDIQVENGSAFVFVPGISNEVTRKPVEMGNDDGFDLEIVSGLDEQDLVISMKK